jgi:mono/diheme cytochrome c family protein
VVNVTKTLGLIALAGVLPLQAATPPTFHKDVEPILQKNCQTCHRPGQIAPMSFLSYQETRPWAKAIKTAVLSKKMPPWFADAHYGNFANDRRLSQADIDTLTAWVDGGGKEGSSKDAPAAREFADGWAIGKPDVVLGMPQAFNVPATGTIDYTWVVIPTGFTEDKWVQGAQCRPGNPAVVHHIIAGIRPPHPPCRPPTASRWHGRETLGRTSRATCSSNAAVSVIAAT